MLQLHNTQLENQNCELARQNLELKSEVHELLKKGKVDHKARWKQNKVSIPRQGNSSSSDASKEMNAFQCRKYFVCASEIWVHPDIMFLFSTPIKKPMIAHDDPTHYKFITMELTLIGA